ncbi:putative uncharacterized protein DDB_G0282499 [Diaphorina citri]|uniref:Uncharacterized protein n=1 Tax=Diaphorina citri TaxID=121845 RepID=A0A3Q0JI19_DIACI|nr:putative uncharacterized protein DDB_G0282499 [Diaphorina citri]
MIHVHLIPHLYVPIMNQPGPGGSEDHKIQENHIPHQQEGSPHYPQQQSDGPPQYPQQQSEGPPQYTQQQSEGPSAPPATSAEVTNSAEPPRGEKHIEENHIIENHYDEFGNPYDPNQSGEDEDDEGEITNVDIHTYSSDDQGGSSHTHYTKNNGVSYESHEETAPSGLGDLTGDHGAQSSSYENSNSYYTIPPNANIHHYNMHREYDHLLSKQPSLHDLNDYKPKPIILNQYQVHENTEEDTSNNNLAPITVSRKPDAPQPTNSPSHNEINTNHLNLNNKHQYGKHYVNQLLDNKHGKHIRLPSSSSVSSENNYQTHLHDSAVKMIVSPNTQLKQNPYSPQHYSFSRAPSYFFDQNRLNYSLKPMQQDGNKPLNSQGGHIPIIKSITVNNEKLPAITLTSDKVTINLNHKLINRNNPFNHRVQLNNKFIPLKSTPSTLNSIASNHLQDGSYFNSKDFLKPLYSFQHLPQLQPLFNADSSNNNNRVLFSNSNNFNMMKLKPQRLSDYAKLSPNRQNYVRKMIMNRQDDVSKNLESMRPPPPAQRQTWSEHYLSRPKHPFQQIIPDSYAKITLPKSIYHLNLIKAPVLSSPNTLQQRIAVGG